MRGLGGAGAVEEANSTDNASVKHVTNRQHGVAQPAAEDALGRLRRYAKGRLAAELGRGAEQLTVGPASRVATGSVRFFLSRWTGREERAKAEDKLILGNFSGGPLSGKARC